MKKTKEYISFLKLKKYIESENYRGYDPFDGLNSRLFQSLPLIKNSRFFKLLWLQFFKRSPINFRKITGVPKEYNNKGLGLFLIGYCNLYKQSAKKEYLEKIHFLSDLLLQSIAKGYAGACWGYNFDWQARAFFQPKNTPTVVATSFIVEALLSAYNITNKKKLLDTAISSSKFVLEDLNRNYDQKGNFAFSYSPIDNTQVFNASLLGAKLLSLVYTFTNETSLIDNAKKAVAFVCERQNNDGSWSYGTLPYHQWIDSFHTGFNLECIATYQKATGDMSFNDNLNNGLQYYLDNFISDKGVPKYYNDKIYPIDVHAPAQLITTLHKLDLAKTHKTLIHKVTKWTIQNMQSDEGYFYYQKHRFYKNKIPYMRWTQAWMFYAMSFLIQIK